MGSASWLRQYEVTLQKNYKLKLRRPFHLSILILSSVLSVIFAWLAGNDGRGPSGDFPVCLVCFTDLHIMFQNIPHLSSHILCLYQPLTDCGQVDPYYVANITKDNNWSAGQTIPLSMNEPWRGGLPVWLMTPGPTFSSISVYWILRDELHSRRWGHVA